MIHIHNRSAAKRCKDADGAPLVAVLQGGERKHTSGFCPQGTNMHLAAAAMHFKEVYERLSRHFRSNEMLCCTEGGTFSSDAIPEYSEMEHRPAKITQGQ
jgi:hypothetical protein